MIKYLFIVINSLSLFLFSLFNDDGVTVTGTIPATITAGQETAIELKVNKGNMSGFARLQLELPEGVTVKQSEDKGASYSFDSNVAKWVWAVQPSESEIVIKVVLVASETAVGTKVIHAKYSYVENNNKQMAEMEPATVTIMTSGIAAAPATSTDQPASTASATSSNSEPPGKITVERFITKTSETEYLISLKVKKGITKGFAKYIDDVVGQLQAKAVKTDGSSFSVADGKIKFVWVNVPDKEEMEVSYTLAGNFTVPIILNGEYSYLEDNQSKKYKLTPDTVKPTVVKNEEKPEIAGSETVKKDSAQTTAKADEPKKEVPAEQLTTDVPRSQPEPVTQKKEGMMSFAVQIGAFTNPKVNTSLLKQRFNINEAIRSDMQGGFSKFMVGSHTEYKNAREHRETIKSANGIKTAFVVAYNGATRITVQEALMASNQKWFK